MSTIWIPYASVRGRRAREEVVNDQDRVTYGLSEFQGVVGETTHWDNNGDQSLAAGGGVRRERWWVRYRGHVDQFAMPVGRNGLR
jgi:hypothetical protein